MRIAIRTLVAFAFLANTAANCCGVGEPELLPVRAACFSFYECAIAVKSEVFATVAFDHDIESVTVDPPGSIEVRIEGAELVLRPTRLGDAVITVTLADGLTAQGWITVGALATTSVGVAGSPTRSERLALYRGGQLHVIAEHRDAGGARLLGHGFESWEITGGALRDVPAEQLTLVPSLERIAVSGDDPVMTVLARPGGTPLEVDVLPPGSTARLAIELTDEHLPLPPGRGIGLARDASTTLTIKPFTADERPILGQPAIDALSASSTDPAIATVEVTDHVRLVARSVGETEIAIRLDGAVVRFPVVVREP